MIAGAWAGGPHGTLQGDGALLAERYMQPRWTLCVADRYLHIFVQRGQKTQQAVNRESVELAGHNQRRLGLRRAE